MSIVKQMKELLEAVSLSHGTRYDTDEITGKYQENLDWMKAKDMLDEYPLGVVVHSGFGTGSFIFRTNRGAYRFWSEPNQQVVTWNWISGIQRLLDTVGMEDYDNPATDPRIGWAYVPMDMLSQLGHRAEWFKKLHQERFAEKE